MIGGGSRGFKESRIFAYLAAHLGRLGSIKKDCRSQIYTLGRRHNGIPHLSSVIKETTVVIRSTKTGESSTLLVETGAEWYHNVLRFPKK